MLHKKCIIFSFPVGGGREVLLKQKKKQKLT